MSFEPSSDFGSQNVPTIRFSECSNNQICIFVSNDRRKKGRKKKGKWEREKPELSSRAYVVEEQSGKKQGGQKYTSYFFGSSSFHDEKRHSWVFAISRRHSWVSLALQKDAARKESKMATFETLSGIFELSDTGSIF